MANGKWLTQRPDQARPVIKAVGTPADLPAGNHWFGFERNVLAKNTKVVDASTGYLEARRRQSAAYTALLEERMRIAQKLAELMDLPNRILDEQRAREHARHVAEQKRTLERLQAEYDRRLALARNEAELAKLDEIGVRANRNLEAARRVSPAEIDRWYAEAEARKNNAVAEREDTIIDLQRGQADSSAASAAGAAQRGADLAVLDHQIELERQRGNEGAVLALLNLRARLRGA